MLSKRKGNITRTFVILSLRRTYVSKVFIAYSFGHLLIFTSNKFSLSTYFPRAFSRLLIIFTYPFIRCLTLYATLEH